MAQLSDDCFAFGGPLLSIEQALALIAGRVDVVAGQQPVPLRAALGRVLAQPLVAPMDVPPFANSAVDGWAVRHADLAPERETSLPVLARVAAGQRLDGPVPPGMAVRIFTGAPLPAGVDTVMMQEDARVEGDRVILRPGLKQGANARRAGEDVAEGSIALPAGRRLRPQDVGMAASLGVTQMVVRTPLRVAIFSTGDELVDPGRVRPAQAIHDSNRYTLHALLARLGCAVTDLGILPDRRDVIAGALAGAADAHDLILTSGGVSTGEEDHVKQAVESQGSLHLWRLAIKPGRPVALGQIRRADGGSAAFVGLPGNPVAVMVTFLMLARPLIQRLQGEETQRLPLFPARAAFDYRKKKDRREFVRVRLEPGDDGVLEARKFPRDGAGILSSMVEADALAVLGEPIQQLAPGDTVPVLPLGLVI